MTSLSFTLTSLSFTLTSLSLTLTSLSLTLTSLSLSGKKFWKGCHTWKSTRVQKFGTCFVHDSLPLLLRQLGPMLHLCRRMKWIP